QTHSVPDENVRRTLVARRMDFAGADALQKFNRALQQHTENVCAAFTRVFGKAVEDGGIENIEKGSDSKARHEASRAIFENPVDAETVATNSAAAIFAAHLTDYPKESNEREVEQERRAERIRAVADAILSAAQESLNPRRALMLAARIAA